MIKEFIGIAIVFLFLTGLSAAAENACVGCHTSVGATKGIVNDWKESKHALNNVTCDKCHEAAQGDKDAISHNGFLITTTPSPKDCANCHSMQVSQFNAGKHSISWSKMTAAARYKAIPNEKMRESMCEGCHSIGKIYADDSAGKCDSCHTRHLFSKEEARQPEACETCHMGLDHEQIEYYKKSKHGMIQETNRTSARAPGCITCHMDEGTHDVSQGTTIGTVSQGAFISNKSSGNDYVKDSNGIAMRAITQEQFDTNRNKMLSICARCHSRNFAQNVLENADEIKVQADKKVGEGITIIEGLNKDGLLDPMPENRPANPVTGNKLTITGQQTYTNTSGIEAEFFGMFKYALIHSWKGAYHMNPDYSHWYGWAQINLDLEKIKSQNRTLRRIAELENAQKITEKGTKATPGFGTELAVLGIMVSLLLVMKRRS
ncbi:MAG: multiheme c-type cytochrome [Candidatus Methanoperedens sp.]|nr:multiheme c-type cytochrome [Candidatus Methanoperedens sp.]CAG0966337.1 Hydroxylamine oxidoreductase [Methanosarcinales archaeon]